MGLTMGLKGGDSAVPTATLGTGGLGKASKSRQFSSLAILLTY